MLGVQRVHWLYTDSEQSKVTRNTNVAERYDADEVRQVKIHISIVLVVIGQIFVYRGFAQVKVQTDLERDDK